jgi:hypothetical protein
MQMSLTLSSTTVPQDDLYQVASNLRNQLTDLPELRFVSPPESKPTRTASIEDKAEPITLLTIALALITSGALKAVIDAIRSVEPDARDGAISYEVGLHDGSGKVKLDAKGLTRTQLEEVIRTFGALIDRVK